MLTHIGRDVEIFRELMKERKRIQNDKQKLKSCPMI